MSGLDMTGAKVIHKSFGEGSVKALSDDYITVLFSVGEKTFPYTHKTTEEERIEMRAAFGAGSTVVNVFTGERIRV